MSFVLLLANSPVLGDKSESFGQDKNRGQILIFGLLFTSEESGGITLLPGVNTVPEATVELLGTSHKTQSDEMGRFHFTKVPDGEMQLRISKPGFRDEVRQVRVDRTSLDPQKLSVEMFAAGTEGAGGVDQARGNIFVAYSERSKDLSRHQTNSLQAGDNLMELLHAIAIDADPFDLKPSLAVDGKRRFDESWNPITYAPNTLMNMPPRVPSRTVFQNLTSQPLWLCFDSAGRMLYVATRDKSIQVFEVDRDFELVKTLTDRQRGAFTSLTLGGDGRHLLATVMGPQSGIMLIDTETQDSEAFLILDQSPSLSPTASVLNREGTRVYATFKPSVGSSGQGFLAVLDPYTGETLGRVAVGDTPVGVALSQDQTQVFVSNAGSGSVSVLQAETLTELARLPVGVSPQKLAVTPDGTRVLVANKGSNSVTFIDAERRAVLGSVNVGEGPVDLAVSPDGSRAYVSNSGDGTITTLDLETATRIHTSTALPRSRPLGITVRPGL